MKERDCANCKHHTEDGCSSWDCEFEAKDLISRADAVKTVIRKCSPICAWQVGTQQYPDCVVAEINALPSAETHEIRTETHGVCLISKDDAMGAVQDHFNADGFKGYDDGQKMMDRIKELPSADAVQGEWEAHRVSLDFICSNCGEACWSDFDYCPHCGARMKGGDDK